MWTLWSKIQTRPGTVARPYNLSTLGNQSERIIWTQEFETSLGNTVRIISTKKVFKISWMWWHMPVIPATLEAETRESLEPGKWRWQWAVSLHSGLSDRARLCPKIKQVSNARTELNNKIRNKEHLTTKYGRFLEVVISWFYSDICIIYSTAVTLWKMLGDKFKIR